MRAVFLTLLLLTGCSSPTPGFIIAPQVFLPQSNQLQQSRFAFNVSDERGLPYTLRLRNGDKVQQIKASNDVRLQLEQTLTQALNAQGAQLDNNSSNRMTVRIAQLQALVEQRTLEHAVTNQVALTVFVQNEQGTFSKTSPAVGNVAKLNFINVGTIGNYVCANYIRLALRNNVQFSSYFLVGYPTA